MRHPRTLRYLWLTLRWMMRDNRPLRSAIQRTAEMADHDLGSAAVLGEIIDKHGREIPADALIELGEALEKDLPLAGMGGAVLASFALREERLVH